MVLDIQQLQDRARRDPTSYRDEFLLQHRRFVASLEVMRLRPAAVPDEFPQLVSFLAHLAESYKTTLSTLPAQLTELVDGENGHLLDPEVRKAVVSALILLRNRGLIEATESLPVFFRLFRVQDKQLRAQLYKHIVSDVRNINRKGRNEKLNRTLQNFMYNMVKNPDTLAAQKSLEVIIELYNRKLWADARTANVIATAVFSPTTKQRVTALTFFLHADDHFAAMKAQEMDSDDETDDEGDAGTKVNNILEMSKKELMAIKRKEGKGVKKTSDKDKRKIKKLKSRLKKRGRQEEDTPASSALHHIYDPTDFAERLFGSVKKSREKFDIKMMLLNMLSRLISTHRLLLLNFYPFLQRYLQPHQKEVTHILSYLAEATHEMVPYEDLQPLVHTICHNFITERNTNEAIAVGLNTVRIMASRVPLVLETDLVHDLIEYKSHKDKGVVMAARSLLEVYRILDPMKLVRKERGRGTDLSIKPQAYGAGTAVRTEIEGLELLDHDSDDELDEAGIIRNKIYAIYEEHRPKKLVEVDGMCGQWAEDLEGLLARVRKKYNVPGTESDEPESEEEQEDDEGGESGAAVQLGDGWAAEEHAQFLASLGRHGSGATNLEVAWVAIAMDLGRDVAEVKSHAAVYFRHLQQEQEAQEAAAEASAAAAAGSEDSGSGSDADASSEDEEEDDGETPDGAEQQRDDPAADAEGAAAAAEQVDEGEAADRPDGDAGAAGGKKTTRVQLRGRKKRRREERLEAKLLAAEQEQEQPAAAPSVSGMDRILTQQEHETLRRRLIEAEMEKEGLGLRGEKGIVRVHADDIEGYQKRAKLDREEKIRQALEGREGRAKFGARKEKHGKHQSTNKMNEKNKNYMMIQMKMQKGRQKLTINQKKRGTGFEAKMKQKGRKQQLGRKARVVEQSRKKTR